MSPPDRAATSRAALALWHRQGKWADVALSGVSMDPIIRDGATLRVRFGPAGAAAGTLKVGDVVLYAAGDKLIAHRVIRIGRGRRAGLVRVKGDPLSSSRGSWIPAGDVLGRVASVTQPDGTRLYLNTPSGRLLNRAAAWISMTLGAVEGRLPGRRAPHRGGSLTGAALRLIAGAHAAADRGLTRAGSRLLTAEERLLIATARPRPSGADGAAIRSAATGVTDWEQVREHAISLGLAPMMYRVLTRGDLEGVGPDALIAALARASHLSAAASIHRREELSRVLDLLAGRGIEPILLKGAAMAATVYEDPLTRTMTDLDLLVEEGRVEDAARALETRGYRPLFRHRHADAGLRAAFYDRHHHATPLAQPRGRAIVELHRHIFLMKGTRQYDVGRIRARARRVTVDGREVLVPAPTDLVLHTCLHMSYADRFVGKLRDLIDLHETITVHGKEIEWGTLLAEVPSDAAARCLYACMDLARRLYGTPVPRDVLHELRRASGLGLFGTWILRAVARTVLFGDSPSAGSVLTPASARWCCDTLLQESTWPTRFRALASLLSAG